MRITIYSDNESYVPKESVENFANRIVAKKGLICVAGHFKESFGYAEFLEVFKIM